MIYAASAGNRLLRVIACLAVLLAAGCGGGMEGRLDSPMTADLRAKKPERIRSRSNSSAGQNSGGTKYQLFEGSPEELNDVSLDPPPGVGTADGRYTVNVDRADVGEAAKLILGDTLGFTYVIDPRVQGTITLSSSRALSATELLDAFEAALRVTGAALVQNGETAKIVAMQDMLEGEAGAADLDREVSAGYGVSAIPLRYISPANMLELMDSFIARSGAVRASKVGNLILLRGTAAERRSMIEIVLSFDVDWMKSQTASIAILSNSTPADMVAKLEAIFADDQASSGINGVKIIPLERLNGVVVISNSRQKVKRAMQWVGRLDKAGMTDTDYFVYAVEHGNAAELAKILSATFSEKGDSAGVTAEVAPEQPTVDISTSDDGGADLPGDQTNQSRKGDLQAGETTASLPSRTAAVEQAPSDSGIRITPNMSNNSLVIRASKRDYQKVLAMLRRLDSPAVQVLINTTIAEVSLNDNLRYGVQAYFNEGDAAGGIFNGNSLKLLPSFPGLNFMLGSTNNPRLVLDALSAVTKVRIVSSPSVLVLENETATIKVGDQVPVKTQQLDKDAGGTVNSFEYRDTGVILKVKPRVNASGLVTIELGQELSSVIAGSGSSTTEAENPTFSQRSITSKVSVYSAQTVVLGGLISGQDSRIRNSVPGVNKIPLIGDLVGKTDNSAKRNELIVFITPQIIQDGQDASKASEELRAKMRSFSLQ